MDILINQQKKNIYIFFAFGIILFISVIYMIYYDVIKDFNPEDLILLTLILIIFSLVSVVIKKFNTIRKDLKMLKGRIKIGEIEAININSEYTKGERGNVYTDKIRLHIKSIENKIYYFISNPAQYIQVINDLRKIAPAAKYILRVKYIFREKGMKKIDKNLNVKYI